MCGIKIWIGPDDAQLWVADGVSPHRLLHVNGVSNRLATTPILTDLPSIGDRDVINPFLSLAVAAHPALDDLDPVKVATHGIFHGSHKERWGLFASLFPKVGSHRNPLSITDIGRKTRFGILIDKVPTAKEPNKHP